MVLAFDPVRFTLRAILDSADITAMRTAAMAAVAARRLARAGDHSVAVIGAGPVGRHSLAALRRVVPVSDVRLWSRRRGAADEHAAGLPGPVRVCESVAEAVAGAGIVVTATPSREPLVQAADLTPGALVLAMGADTRGKRELGEGVLLDATVVADVRPTRSSWGSAPTCRMHSTGRPAPSSARSWPDGASLAMTEAASSSTPSARRWLTPR